MEWFVSNGFTVLAPDMIGVGEMGPGVFDRDAFIDSVSHNIWYASILIGRSIVGIRAGDVIRLTPFSSYQSIVMNHFYNSSFIPGVVPGALKAYNLPDLAASLAPRKLMMAGVTDGHGKNTDTENINKDHDIIKIAYQNK